MPDPDLRDLYDELVAKSRNRFYIDGIGGPQQNDVEILIFEEGYWKVYYTERGIKGKVLFLSEDKQEAIDYYRNHVMRQENNHLIVFTRDKEKLEYYKRLLTHAGVKIRQNDMQFAGGLVYRLFAVNEAVKQAKALFKELPYRDAEL